MNVKSLEEVKTKDDFYLIEIKTTSSKSVKELPYGVFFGFTENEENLFKTIDNYRLCIVHTVLEQYVLLDYDDYTSLIQNKRVQYQIKRLKTCFHGIHLHLPWSSSNPKKFRYTLLSVLPPFWPTFRFVVTNINPHQETSLMQKMLLLYRGILSGHIYHHFLRSASRSAN